jgi:hypothetical protein
MYRILIALAVAAGVAAPAQAHWEYTRWGMTLAEARQANRSLSAGDDPRNSVDGSLVRLSGPYAMGGRRFTARLGFDGSDRLNMIYLQAENPRDCPAIIAAFDAAHGRGQPSTSSEVLEVYGWDDSAGGNFIQVFMIGFPGEAIDCQVRYQPPQGGGTKA